MSKSLYISATEARSGKSAVVLGIMQLLMAHIRKVAVFRPIISDNDARDHDIDLILRQFKLNMPYERTYAYKLGEAKRMLNEGKQALLLENTLNKFKELEAEYDFVLCEGTDYLGGEAALEFEMNSSIVSNLGCPVLAVVNGQKKDAEEILESTLSTIETFEEKGLEVMAVIINRTGPDVPTSLEDDIRNRIGSKHSLLVYAIPDEKSLGNPTINDVVKWLDAQVLYGHGRLDTQVEDILVAAMHISNYLEYLGEGSLIVTPGDRSDIVLASLASRLSSSYPDISGIVLTGGLQPPANVHRLIEGWTGVPVPILSVPGHTYKSAQILNGLHGTIDPENPMKIASALGLFESCVNTEELRSRMVSTESRRITPLMFEYTLIEKAKIKRQRIVLPEGSSNRILEATDILTRRGVAQIILLGDPDAVRKQASDIGANLGDAQIIDPAKSEHFDDYVRTYMEARKHKGVTRDTAHDRMSDPTYFATMMVHKGHADGMVSGSITTTAQTIRPAFEFVKTKPGASIVSSVFLMCQNDRVLVYGDCAVNPNPGAEQLAEIAINSAETASIFGIDPKVAMLSYSTGDSGTGADVEKVIEATRMAREKAPQLAIEGPLQYDAAIDPEVASTKLPGSTVAGHATVFIFPDLNTGNNTYKAVQRSVPGSVAIGPVLQGLNKPVNDLSRGCTVRDIVNTVAITAIQSQAEAANKDA
ncbi:phosphate acetyltransferase [Pseudodesulfovibrio senegalensis]|uniref:Phosphate acetyltransferase n=1 Tax=Pseudodesulfovibrio senegalensis TaxID=1721087 RepID=A0A6N6N273_9BACT|nr:phosphate acetyltransferase [Pseudodesulfovibrio senegalensis]KAB1440291.1 phosphate acetyltransferase [Pseudodesulfovibrio senegalensis]